MDIFADLDALAPMKTENGTVGIFLGQDMPDRPSHFSTPAGDILVITAKLLLLAELEYGMQNGPAGYKVLRQRFADSGTHHVSSLSRESVV